MTKRHLMIGLPCYSGEVWIATFKSLLLSIQSLGKVGIDVSFHDLTGNPMIGMARSLLLAEFVNNQTATDLLFIDHDVAWPNGAIERILSHDVDLVGGVYPRRFDPPSYVVRPFDQVSVNDKGLAEVDAVAGGFMRITRACVLRMIEAYPESYFKAERYSAKSGYDLFHVGRNGDEFWGEDYEFCRKWRVIGGTVWADAMIPFIHAGFKEFRGVGPWYNWLQGER